VDQSFIAQARKCKRVEVSLETKLVRANGEAVDVELLDLSFYGLRARGSAGFTSGELVKIVLPPFGAVRARVTWVREGAFGCAFPIALDVRKCVPQPPA
jgi:hypothetical protein